MKSLKAKFGKFAISDENAAKLKGGYMMICGDEIVASDSLQTLWEEMKKRGNCQPA